MIYELIENINKEIEISKRYQVEVVKLKSTIAKRRISPKRSNSIFEQSVKKESMNLKLGQLILSSVRNREKRIKRNEQSLRYLCDIIKCTNICIIGIPEGKEKEKRAIFEEKLLTIFIFHNERCKSLNQMFTQETKQSK